LVLSPFFLLARRPCIGTAYQTKHNIGVLMAHGQMAAESALIHLPLSGVCRRRTAPPGGPHAVRAQAMLRRTHCLAEADQRKGAEQNYQPDRQ